MEGVYSVCMCMCVWVSSVWLSCMQNSTTNVRELLCLSSHSLSLSHTHTHTHSLSLSLSHTHTHTHTISLSSEKRAEFRQHRGVFSLLASHPETRPTPKKPKKKEDAEWVKVQMNTFMKWANSHLEKSGRPPMTDLTEDMKDGTVLIALLESLTGREIGMK